MQQLVSMLKIVWSTHQFCVKGCSPYQPWIKQNTTPLQRQWPILSMEPVSPFSSTTQAQKVKEKSTGSWSSERRMWRKFGNFWTPWPNVRPAFFTKKKPSPAQNCVTHPDSSLELAPGIGVWVAGENHCDRWTSWWDVVRPSCFKMRGKTFEVRIASICLCCGIRPSQLLLSNMCWTNRRDSSILEPWPDASHCCWPDNICRSQTGPVALAGNLRFGGLHIEMVALKSIWVLLKDSGWTEPPVEAGIPSPGTAD